MNSIVHFGNEIVRNVVYKEKYCDCPLHRMTLVQQLEGKLCNGKPIVVLFDWSGYHVVIGERGKPIDLSYLPDAVSEPEMWRIVMEAVSSD